VVLERASRAECLCYGGGRLHPPVDVVAQEVNRLRLVRRIVGVHVADRDQAHQLSIFPAADRQVADVARLHDRADLFRPARFNNNVREVMKIFRFVMRIVMQCFFVQQNILVADYLFKIFGKVKLDKNTFDQIAALALQDKKNKGNKILCVLQDGIGNAKLDCEISLDEIKDALNSYMSL